MVRQTNFGVSIALGAGVGAAFGVALHNLPIGVAIGTALGVALGMVWQRNKTGVAHCGPTSDCTTDSGPPTAPSTRS
jgi:hypothetical protein